jgi:uncharacterized protein
MSAAAVYEGTARHRRFAPVSREFAPRLFLAYLDVEALPGSLDRLPGWSARRPAPVHFRRRDFFDGQPGPLADGVRDLVEERLGRRPDGPVHLLAHLRTFGWLFNPLTVYYCWDADGRTLDALVLEITNTPWGERNWRVLDARTDARAQTAPKTMHVSPFLPMDVDYRVTWTAPGDELHLNIAVVRDRHTVFSAGLALRRSVLDRRRAVGVLVRHPALALRVSLAIYCKAAALFLARVPVYRHPARPPLEVRA